MTRGQYAALVLVFILCVAGIALKAISIGTDNWYQVQTAGGADTPSYHFGLWRRCYDDTVPPDIPNNSLVGMNKNCVYLELVKSMESSLTLEEQRFMHLLRSHVGLICASCIIQFSTLIILILGLWPSGSCGCKTLTHSTVYIGAGVLAFISTLAGMAGGICFIALRDLEVSSRGTYNTTDVLSYDWSFLLSWISTGLCLLQATILVYLYRFVYEKSDYYYYGSKPYLL